jgi:hypothetical protein
VLAWTLRRVVPKKRPEKIQFTTHVWGESEGIEADLRKLTNEVRALRQELTDERKVPAFPSERRLPARVQDLKPTLQPGKPSSPPRRKHR